MADVTLPGNGPVKKIPTWAILVAGGGVLAILFLKTQGAGDEEGSSGSLGPGSQVGLSDEQLLTEVDQRMQDQWLQFREYLESLMDQPAGPVTPPSGTIPVKPPITDLPGPHIQDPGVQGSTPEPIIDYAPNPGVKAPGVSIIDYAPIPAIPTHDDEDDREKKPLEKVPGIKVPIPIPPSLSPPTSPGSGPIVSMPKTSMPIERPVTDGVTPKPTPPKSAPPRDPPKKKEEPKNKKSDLGPTLPKSGTNTKEKEGATKKLPSVRGSTPPAKSIPKPPGGMKAV